MGSRNLPSAPLSTSCVAPVARRRSACWLTIATFTKFASIAFGLAVATAGAVLATPSRESIEQTIDRAMKTFLVPGMAVSIVYDDEVYYAGGRGVREVGSTLPVDEETLFQIASVSKAFTAATLAILADDGRLSFDDRVIDHLPEFRMYDPWVTREFTVRDLLTHRSGLPLGAGDLLIWPEGNATRAEIIHAMRYLKPSSSFRSRFAYDNLLYIVAGEVAARVSGMSFEELLEQRLLSPLGMKDCTASLERVPPGAPRATPHLLMDGEIQTTGKDTSTVIAPAGGINCSAASMARWMAFLLREGVTADGARLISSEQFGQLVAPVTVLPASPYLVEHAGSYVNAYALGWNVTTFFGQPMLAHSGGLWGMTTYLMVLPEQGLGIFASNNLMSVAPHAVVLQLADQFLQEILPKPGVDWIEILSKLYEQRQAAGAAKVAEDAAQRAVDSTPSLPLESYAGTYRDPWYGAIHITLEEDGRLWFRSDRNPPLNGPLEHFQYDTFIARWTDRQLLADAYVSFSLSPDGTVERIRMKAVSPTTDFSYDFHDLDLQRVE